MSVELHVEPRVPPLTREEFCRTKPPNSIALDGYVYGGPWFEHKGPYVSFNHHEEVDRLATRATCGQVLMAIRQGLFSTFIPVGRNKLHLWVNDCDEDVCLSTFLLRHGFLSKNVSNPALNRIVFMEDAMDTTAGSYPFPPDEKLAWVFDTYRKFRLAGGLERKDPNEYLGIIEDTENRIMQYIVGNAGRVEIDTSYEVLHEGKGWVLIQETGSHAKTGVFGDGYQAYISVRKRPNGRYTYSIGKVAFYDLDMELLFKNLNTKEKTLNCPDRWGGGNTVGGSPRVSGSSQTPEEVAQVFLETLKSNNSLSL